MKPKKRRHSPRTGRPATPRPAVPVLRFLGATGTVTGSRFLIDTPKARVLVDCGLYQGLKDLRQRNWDVFPADPETIDAIVLTHAHLDHSGYIPALARHGFHGRIFATRGTADLSAIVLPDSGHLQEEDAAYANRKGYSKHAPALPLYTEEDAQACLRQFKITTFDTAVDVAEGVQAILRPAGHILGSSTVLMKIEHVGAVRTVEFSGDLGRPNHPILRPPAPPATAEVLLVESTYGDRRHEDEASLQRFQQALVRTAERRGVIVIPSFAVDRTEIVLFHLRRLMNSGGVPQMPVYVDSPMAIAALDVYRRAVGERDGQIREEHYGTTDPFDPGQLIPTRTVEESKAINEQTGPTVIVSASGMATGGRVLHHLANRLPDPRNTVILVGFQAAGTRGRSLLDGAASVKMLGRYVPVRAEIVDVPAFSVHADGGEILSWLRSAPRPPQTVFVVHGEPAASAALHQSIEKELGWNAAVPRYLEQVRLD